MKLRSKLFSALIIISLFVLACDLSFGEKALSEEEKLQTAVAQTVSANQTQDQPPQEETLPTITGAPTATEKSPPADTPKPCNAAEFISETIPDETELALGQDFVKTWRLKNTGTCTWNTNYEIVFSDGDKLGGPSSKNLGQQVNPGETVDFSVDMKVPDTAGTYKGYWKVKDDQANTFVHNLWVEIIAEPTSGFVPMLPLIPMVPFLALQPDLVITALQITPSTPTMGENTQVRVRAHNEGNLDSGGFTVEWYGLETAANPGCTWTVSGGLVADGSVWLECNYVFASWYPINKTTIAYIDTVNTVYESDEDNNTFSISPFGVYK